MIRLDDSHNYILITPIKDEYENILRLKQTVLNQTVKPILWVILDGDNNDDSFQMINKIFEEYEWIYIIKQKKFHERGYSHINFAQAVNEGYQHAKHICKKKGISYSFIGKIDATVLLAKDYFKILLSEMKKDQKLAIICGRETLYNKGKKTKTHLFNIPRIGFKDIRLYNKEFFEGVAGYPLSYCPDSILLIKAINNGLNVKISDEACFIETRLGGTKIGIWKGMKLKGKAMYVLGYHPILLFLNALYTSLKTPPHYQGLPIIWEYILCILRRDEKIKDEDVLEYYGKKRLKEIINSILGKIIG